MSSMSYIPGVGAQLKTGRAIAGPTWAGGASALPAQPRAPRLGQPPRYPTFDGPPESGLMPGRGNGGGAGAYRGFHGQGGGGASWATRFAPDDGTKIKTKTQSDMGLSNEIGDLDGFYATQDRSLDPFYRGSENSTGTTVPEVVGRAQEQGFSSGFGGSLLQNGKPYEGQQKWGWEPEYKSFADAAGKMPVQARAEGGPVKPGQPYLVGEEGPELIVPKQAGTVIPNNELNPAAGWAKGAFDVLPERAPVPMPAQQPALPLSQADWASPTARGVKSPEMQPAAGWASNAFNAGPDAAKATGQVASFAGADPGVQYSSPPPRAAAPPASFADIVGGLAPPALPPGLSFADFRQAGREYYKTPQGIRDWIDSGERAQEKAQALALEDKRYQRSRADELADQKANRDWQDQRATAASKAAQDQDNQEAAPPANVPEGYVAVPNKFTAAGKPAGYELVRKPEEGTQERDIEGTAYRGIYSKEGRLLQVLPKLATAQEPMTQEDIEAARAAGADVTVKNGNTTMKLPGKKDTPSTIKIQRDGRVLDWDQADELPRGWTVVPKKAAPGETKPAANAKPGGTGLRSKLGTLFGQQ